MAPGKDATQMNFAWYSKDKAKASENRVSTNADMSGARSFLGTSKTGTVIDGTQYYTNKAITAWAVEIDGEIDATDIRPTRAWARADRSDFAEFYGSDAKVSVRKVMIIPVSDR